MLKEEVLSILSKIDDNLKKWNQQLIDALSADNEHLDSEIVKFLTSIDYNILKQNSSFIMVKEILIQIMDKVASELAANWNSPRYSRESFDD